MLFTKRRAVLSFLAFTGSMLSAFAEVRERYTIEDGGRARGFVVAHDEFHVEDGNRRARRQVVAGVATAEAVRLSAERHAVMTGEEAELVLYPEGAARTEFTRRILTKKVAVRLRAGENADAVAKRLGVVSVGALPYAKGWFIFQTTKTGGALEVVDALRGDASVEAAEPQLRKLRQKRFTPNDPLFSSQWHLRDTNPGSGIFGLDVKSVWDTWKGTGVRIGIVDDGLQTTHPDLSPNVDTVNDHDWNDSTPNDPNPDVLNDFHGTSCAGVAAARGNNGIGVSGAAPEATLVGLRLIAAAESDADDADAMGWRKDIIQVKSNSWGPQDNGTTLEAPGTLMAAALADAVQMGRGGLGTIFLWAAGNGGDVGDNSNYDGYANSIYTIAVAALGSDGVQSYYSEPGANVIVTTPSSGGPLGIVTTDLTGANGYNGATLADKNYTNDFGGTSSACPLAAGCVALLLQSKPTLGWRDVQEILIRSAAKVDPADTDWSNNGAGWHFNHKYGAGLLNVQAAVNLAATWTNLPAQQNVVSAQLGLGLTIPNDNTTGITRTFNLAGVNLRMERATVKVNISHASRGQLAVTLTSPRGTVNRLAEVHSDTGNDYTDWTFSTVRCWGEHSSGNWTLKITDKGSTTTGTLTDATLTVFGTPTPPLNQPPSITAATISPISFSDETVSVSNVAASDPEGDAITFSYQWMESTDGVTFTGIAGATGSSFALTNTQSGKKVRCDITATATGGSSAPFSTTTVSVNRRPIEVARTGQAYSYDSDLFLFVSSGPAVTRNVIINEFSQGPSGLTSEWVELLVLRNSDLRGCTLGDLSTTKVTFASVALWSNVPAGTLIVIYKGIDRDGLLPADNTNLAGGAMVIPNNNASVFVGTTWPSLGNTSADLIEFRGADGAFIDGLSFNGDATYTPALGSVGSAKAANFTGNTDAGAELLANWAVTASSSVTPAAGNGTANAAFIASLRASGATAQFRLSATSDVVPGLTIDPTTGILSGTPNVPAGGLFQIVIERFSGSTVVSQTYPLLVADASGKFTLPAGKTWTLDQATTLSGDLLVNGTLNTNGRALIVNGKVTLAAGSAATNTGSISYLQRSGAALPGTSFLIANAANDLSDIDGDGIVALTEFALGLDPSTPGISGLPTIATVANHLTLSFSVPTGASGVTDAVEVSGDLTNWNSGAGFTETVSDTTTGTTRSVTVRDLGTASPRYIRLRVSR